MLAKTAIFASIAALAIAPTAVNAAPTAAPTAAATATPASPTATSRADDPNQRYCIQSEQPFSRIRRTDCDKLSGWQSQGVDPRLLPRRK